MKLRPLSAPFLAAATVLISLSNTALSQQSSMIQEVGSAERIEVADQLRTLSQEVAAAACFYHAGVHTNESRKMLQMAVEGFDARLDALEFGDEEHGILGPEGQPAVLRRIASLRQTWDPIADSAAALIEDGQNKQAMATIYEQQSGAFEATSELLTKVTAEYANPVELLGSDAILLDIVGQQAVNSQRVAYDACRLLTDPSSETYSLELEETVENFENALFALRDGLPSVGVPAAPTDEIRELLNHSVEDWDDVRAIVDDLLAGNAIDQDEAATLYSLMQKKLEAMEELTHLYVAYSKRAIH